VAAAGDELRRVGGVGGGAAGCGWAGRGRAREVYRRRGHSGRAQRKALFEALRHNEMRRARGLEISASLLGRAKLFIYVKAHRDPDPRLRDNNARKSLAKVPASSDT
jgi:hypothetical protein